MLLEFVFKRIPKIKSYRGFLKYEYSGCCCIYFVAESAVFIKVIAVAEINARRVEIFQLVVVVPFISCSEVIDFAR